MSLPRPTKIKNKTPAPIQITAEQILREARERHEPDFRPPVQKISDPAELADHRLRKRKEFEDQLRRNPSNKKAWVNYAAWEASQQDFNRARSVWERALDQHPHGTDHSIWLNYGKLEMKNGFVNHARNVWDRAVSILPRVDQLWYEYVHMEEKLGNFAGARQILERWMSWQPDQQGWKSYIEFELRYKEVDRARAIFERFVECHPKASAWIEFAKFEVKNNEVSRARDCYARALEKLHGVYEEEDEEMQGLYAAYAEFEERWGEVERARGMYKHALDQAPMGKADSLFQRLLEFEKQHGDGDSIEEAIRAKTRFECEKEVRRNPLNYDAWFEYIRLEESVGVKEKIRDVYKRATANLPPSNKEKRYWKRYIYLWIKHALYEELEAKDMEGARRVYKDCLSRIPHKKFSFAKIWLMAAMFEIRQMNHQGARLLLGQAIGMAPKKDKIFKKYIELELEMGNIDHCRTLYQKYLECSRESCYVYIKFAEFEACLSEPERARAIFECGIDQPLDKPIQLWKAYIDFEISEREFGRVRDLYKRLLDCTQKHLDVWRSYAQFEATAHNDDDDDEHRKSCLDLARGVFEEALGNFKDFETEMRKERAILLKEWMEVERSFGELGDVERVRAQLPMKLKRRVENEGLKLLENAYQWKKQKLEHA